MRSTLYKRQLTVYYDNWCPVCLHVKDSLERLDLQHCLVFEGIRDNPNIPLSIDVMSKVMYINKNQKLYHGYSAFLEITRSIILLTPLFPAMWFVKKIGLGDIMYDYIAKHRKIIPVGNCNDTTCRLH